MAKKSIEKPKAAFAGITPLTAEGSCGTTTTDKSRRNISSIINRTDKLTNIDSMSLPYGVGSNRTSFNIRAAVILCQKAYFGVPIFGNVINLMVEFSKNEIKLKGSNTKTRDFFSSYFDRVNLWNLQGRFFREYYRSGNVFIYKMMAKIDDAFKNAITKVFGKESQAKSKYEIPLNFIILNPADIEAGGAISFASAIYYKVLTPYEIQRLRLRETDEEKAVYNNLDPDIKKQIDTKNNVSVLLKLNPDEIAVVFNNKQDYEPFAVPFGYSVLEDIDYKIELKKMDMALARTLQQVVLLVTMGYEGKDGSYNVNQNQLGAVQQIFNNQSIGRVLVADFTTKVEFVIPQIADILDPKKYEIVNKDIKEGLNYVLAGGSDDKFANKSMNIKVFIQRLKDAREAFLRDFLTPQIKLIAKELNFKNYPTPYFEDIDFKDELEYYKVFTRLAELGIFTPQDTFDAMESGKIPTNEESIENQKLFKPLKDDGLYEPITGGPATQKEMLQDTNKNAVKMQDTQLTHDAEQQKQQRKHEAANPPPPAPAPIHFNLPGVKKQSGRPTGINTKQKSTRKISPIQADVDDNEDRQDLYSLSKLTNNLKLAAELDIEVKKTLMDKYKLKKLDEKQINLANELCGIIIANEEVENWKNKITNYIDNPMDANYDRVSEIREIAAKHLVDMYLASLLFISKKEN